MEIMTWEGQTNDLKEVVNKLISDSTANLFIHSMMSSLEKQKMLKEPKFELGKLMELRGEGSSSGKATGDETGAEVERPDWYEPPVQESV